MRCRFLLGRGEFSVNFRTWVMCLLDGPVSGLPPSTIAIQFSPDISSQFFVMVNR